MRKRIMASLLALCMALSLLGAAAAEEAPLLTDGAGETRDEETASGEPRDEETPAGEEAFPAVLSEADGDSASVFTVTTGAAAAITAFSATLSMTVTYPAGWSLNEKTVKIYGFQYCIGNTFDPANVNGEWESYYGNDGQVIDDPATRTITYSGPVACSPGTTYTYRAYFSVIEGDTSSYQNTFYADEVKTFTTSGAPSDLQTLTPGTPVSFQLTGGQPAQFSLGEGLTGFYQLSCEVTDATEGISFSFSLQKNGSWEPHYEGNPLYLDGQRYGMITLNAPSEVSATCTVSLCTYNMTQLPSSGTTQLTTGGSHYLAFAPEQPGLYKLTFQRIGGSAGTDADGYVNQWSAAAQNWEGGGSISNGFTYLLSPKENETCYLGVSIYQDCSYSVTVESYTAVTAPVVRSGEVGISNSLQAVVSVTVELPDGYEAQQVYAGIEYTVDGVTQTNGCGSCTGNLWTQSCYFDLLPGKTYTYRAYMEILDDGGSGRPVIWEEGSHTYTAAAVQPVQLAIGENAVQCALDAQSKLLSFTPAESCRYTFDISGFFSFAFWDAQNAVWDYFSGTEAAVKNLEAGETLYIQAKPSYTGGTVTVAKFTATVTDFSIAASQPDYLQDFRADIPVTAAVPIGSSFQMGAMLNGVDSSYIIPKLNYESESCNETIWLPVLPDKTYTLTPYIERINPNTHQAIAGSRVTGSPITFNTGSFTTVPLAVSSPQTLTVTSSETVCSFTPAEDGYYQIAVTGADTAAGFLNYWQYAENSDAVGEWVDKAYFSGSKTVRLSAKAGIPQYFKLRTDSPAGIGFQVEIVPYASTVTAFAVSTGSVQKAIPGFTASVPVEVDVPLGKYCKVSLEVLEDNGRWYSVGASYGISGAEGEHQTRTLTLETFPNTTCTYRAVLVPTDSNGRELSGAAYVYSGQNQFKSSAPSEAQTPELTEGQTHTGVFQSNNLYFTFTPPSDGAYKITVTGDVWSMYIGTSGGSGWQFYPLSAGEPATVKMEGRQYIRLSGAWKGSYSIQVSKVVSTVTGFTVTSGTAAVSENGLELQVPVTVTAPIASRYSCIVDYYPGGDRSQYLSVDSNVQSSAEETMHFLLSLPVYPGKSYTYSAGVFDQDAREYHDETTEHTVSIPALATQPAAMSEGTSTSPSTGKTAYSFTPGSDGNYLFTVTGDSGTLTVIKADGTWLRLHYYENAYSGDSRMDINVQLPAGQPAYVILEERSTTQASVTVRSTALSVRPDYSSGNLTVTMEAEQAGRYIFAAYDREGKLLTCAIRDKTTDAAETLTAELKTRGGEYVKAFLTDGAGRPLSPSERTPVSYR